MECMHGSDDECLWLRWVVVRTSFGEYTRTQTRAAPRYANEGPRTGHSRDRIRGRIRRRVGETSLLCRAIGDEN